MRYAQQRKTFGKPIAEHQAIALKLADMATRVEAARLLIERRRRSAYDRGERCDMEAGMAKLFATEAALENATEAMRIHGAYGYSKEFNIERYYRDAPLLCIGEGTNEIQRIIIARQLVAAEPRLMLPLQGVRILAVEQYGAGPFGTHAPRRPRRRGHQDREPRRRRRRRPPRASARISSRQGDSQFFQTFNRNKKSLTLDLKHPEGQAVLHDLVAPAPTRCSNNLRGDLPAKLGLTTTQLEGGQPEHRLRAPVGLRPHRRARRLAGLRLPDAGRGRLPLAHRRAGRAADALGPVDRRPHDRPAGARIGSCWRASSMRAPPAPGATSTSACSTWRCHNLSYLGDVVSERRASTRAASRARRTRP